MPSFREMLKKARIEVFSASVDLTRRFDDHDMAILEWNSGQASEVFGTEVTYAESRE